MRELKAGGMAVVISSENMDEVGRVVTLVCAIKSGEFYKFPDGEKYALVTTTPEFRLGGGRRCVCLHPCQEKLWGDVDFQSQKPHANRRRRLL
ncbi:hypothetical protein [Enterobacter kobei]